MAAVLLVLCALTLMESADLDPRPRGRRKHVLWAAQATILLLSLVLSFLLLCAL